MTTERKPHVHAELIKAWADGAIIECRTKMIMGNLWTAWYIQHHPSFETSHEFEYRIKPEPKPDVVRYGRATNSLSIGTNWSLNKYPTDNVKAIFDGETEKLKAVEII